MPRPGDGGGDATVPVRVTVDDPYADADVRAAHPVAERLAGSERLGWALLHASRWRERAVAEAHDVPVSASHRLVLVTRGRYVIESRHDRTWHRTAYGPGSLGLTAAGRPSTLRWRTLTEQPLESLHVYLSTAVVEETRDELTRAATHPFPHTLRLDDHGVVGVVRDIGWALQQGAPALVADAAAYLLAGRLVTCGPVPRSTPAARGLDPLVLARVVDYLHAHLATAITLDELSTVAHLSKHHLLRQFKAATGQPPHRYLHELRMEHAVALLTGSSLTVTAVARACGYASERQFGTAFARRWGQSPSRYRAQQAR